MVNRGEEKVWVQMNVVPRSTGNTNSGTRELTLKCKLKCYFKFEMKYYGINKNITIGGKSIYYKD